MPEIIGSSKSIFGFDPRSVPGCQLWLDAADRLSMTVSGSSVTQWNDKSGNARNYTTLGTAPIYSSGDGGSVTFSYGQALANTSTWSGNGAGVDIFAVSTPWPFTQYNDWRTLFRGASAGHRVIIESSSSRLGYYGPAGFQQFGSLTLGQTKSLLYVTTNTSFVTSGALNGTVALSVAGSFQESDSQAFYCLGAYQGGPSQPWGTINEVMVFSNLTTVQRQAVEGYLARKWGITVPTTHPFFKIPPFTRYFNPVDIPGCVLWLDGADGSSVNSGSIADGGAVTTWRDKSGFLNNAANANGNPVWTSNAIGGLPAMYMPNATNGPRFLGTFSPALQTSTLSVFAVAYSLQTSGIGHDQRLVSITSNASSANDYNSLTGIMPFDIQSNNLTTYYNNTRATNNALSANTRFVASMVASNTSINAWLNGTPFTTTGVPTSNLALNSSAYGVGGDAWTTGGEEWSGYIGEILIYTGPMTTAQRQQLEGYLSWKWSIGLNVITPAHPFYTFPPSALLPFYPTDISGCQMWLDSADSSTITYASGVNISSWNDKSGTGNNATVSGVAYATYTSNAVLFNNSLYTTPYTGVPNNETAFIVFSTSNGATTNAALIGTSQNGARGIWAGYSGFTGGGFQAVGVVRAGQAWVAGSPANSVPNLTRTIATVTTTTNSATALRLNGSTTTYTGGASYNAGLTYLGRENSTSFGYIGYAMEIIFYNVVLSASQRQRVEGYLASKWNVTLASNHPYYKFVTSRISPPAPVGAFTPTISGAVITGTWGASSEAVNYTVFLFSSPTSGGTYSISQGPFTTTASTYSFTVTAGNFYRVYVVVNGVVDSSATTISGFVQYVAAAWTPATAVSTGAPLITWFKGDDGLTSTVWSNRGTNGGTASLTNASVATGSQNGLNGVNFTSIPAYGTFTQTFSTQARGCFAVVKFPTVSTTISQFLVAITNSWNFVLAASNPLQIMMIQQGVAIRVWSSNVPAMASNTAYVIGCVNSAVSTASNAVIQNGTQYGFQTNSLAASYPVSAQTTFLNYYNAGNCNVPCYFYEVLCYSGELAAADITNITGYLRTKWGTS